MITVESVLKNNMISPKIHREPFNYLRTGNQHAVWVDTGDYYRPHGCNVCRYKFADKAKLIRHLNSVHISQRI